MIPCCKDRQFTLAVLASEQALRGVLLAGREKKGELATTSLEFEYLHRKSRCEIRCEMLIGRDNNDLSRVFQCLFTFVLVPALRWLTEISQLSLRGTKGELKAEFKFQRRSCKLSFLFPPQRQNAPESLLVGYTITCLISFNWPPTKRAWQRTYAGYIGALHA